MFEFNNKEIKQNEGSTCWTSPSNIAIVKYWGKHGEQLPRNPSLSLTLDKAFTKTKLSWKKKEETNEQIAFDFFFEGKENVAFGKKVEKFLERMSIYFPYIKELQLKIESENSFPHSSGIASSASSMSALSLCLAAAATQIYAEAKPNDFLQKTSYCARLGSGSASRSLFPFASVWGNNKDIENSNDLFAIDWSHQIDSVFKSYQDSILIISNKEKAVSSRAGHQLMEGNRYAQSRFEEANERMLELIQIMKTGDLDAFGLLAEAEAMTLHALMMMSSPPYMLFSNKTIEGIEKIQQFRKEKKLPLYFTLDAGPNLHLLYPKEIISEVKPFIQEELEPICAGGVIWDQVGEGPKQQT